MNLKTVLLKVLDAAAVVSGPAGRGLVEFVRWLVNRFVPDEAAVEAPAVGDAPDVVKDYVGRLFDTASAYVSNYFYRKAIEAVKHLVVNYALDLAWDAVMDRVVVTAAGEKIDDAAVDSAVASIGV